MKTKNIAIAISILSITAFSTAFAKSTKDADFEKLQKVVKEHQGEWKAVYGIMEGTFSKPMTTADGKVIQPTGKSFKLPMATIGHWTKEGPMDEEYLFWDNQTYMNQIGLGK